MWQLEQTLLFLNANDLIQSHVPQIEQINNWLVSHIHDGVAALFNDKKHFLRFRVALCFKFGHAMVK